MKKLKKKERCAVNAHPAKPLKITADFGISTEIDWLTLKTSDNLDWNTILINAFVGISENFLKSVKRLLSV